MSHARDEMIKHRYVGSRRCKVCHLKTHRSWAKTAMGRALETLEPGRAVEAKKKHGLDPEKDYTRDRTCLPCHTTGFGRPGGYAIPEAGDRKALRRARSLAGVGCEACHGPGGDLISVFKDLQKTRRHYALAELLELGLTRPDEKRCQACHNERSPTHDPSRPFDFATMAGKRDQIHAHIPLKQRKKP